MTRPLLSHRWRMHSDDQPLENAILVLNVGSSSLKFAVFCNRERLISGAIERLGSSDSAWKTRRGEEEQSGAFPDSSPEMVLSWLEGLLSGLRLVGIAHRIVHGGDRFTDHCLVDEEVLNALRVLKPLAPEHLPWEVQFLEATRKHFSGTPSIVCFDTVFHAGIPEVARTYALPRRVREKGVRRFGFHGLSYASLVWELAKSHRDQGCSVLAHLGNGASMAAVRDGKGIDTTMGFTPAAGLVMGSRCGDIDPGIFRFVAEQFRLDPSAMDHLFNHESGLAGLSGMGSDVRDLQQASGTNHEADLALQVFCHVARKHVAAMSASLGGIDRLVFTGGIGQNAPAIRARICEGLEFLGISLDASANEKNARVISNADSPAEVLVVPANEEAEMARIAERFTSPSPTSSNPTIHHNPTNQ